MASLPGQPG